MAPTPAHRNRTTALSAMMASVGCGLVAVIIAVSSGLASVAEPASGPCRTLKNADLRTLERSYSIGAIRVFWTEQPPVSGVDHRLAEHSRRDLNGNGVPDLIENIARQADAARQAFVELGFPDPLENPRYRAVRHIDINMLTMRFNGRAYDGAIRYPDAPGRGSDCTLRIDISTNLESHLVGSGASRRQAEFTQDWFVVAHEMFHLFQYGLTRLKRGWINEPSAKWAEYALRRGDLFPPGAGADIFPQTFEEFEISVIRDPTSSLANRFWSHLIEATEPKSQQITLPPDLSALTYTDGRFIFKDNTIRGASLVALIFEEIGQWSSKALVPSNKDKTANQTKKDRTSPRHDRPVLELIQIIVRNQPDHDTGNDVFMAPN